MSDQNVMAKMNQIKRFIEMDTDDSIVIRAIDEWFFLDYYISQEDKEPYMTKKIAQLAVKNMDWSFVVLLLNQVAPESEQQR